MKKLLVGLMILGSFQVSAWVEIIICNDKNDKKFVIDKNCYFRGKFPEEFFCEYQGVIRDIKINKHLFKKAGNKKEIFFSLKANKGYGNFSFGINFELDIAKIKVENINDSNLQMTTYYYAHGTYHPSRKFIFNSCHLIRNY